MMAVTEEEGEATQRQLTHSYCCIDYPRFIDMLQVHESSNESLQ